MVHDMQASGPQFVGNVLVDPSAKIGQNCKIGPDVVIGPNVVVGEGTRLQRCTLMESSIVKPHAWIQSAIIGWRCTVGESAFRGLRVCVWTIVDIVTRCMFICACARDNALPPVQLLLSTSVWRTRIAVDHIGGGFIVENFIQATFVFPIIFHKIKVWCACKLLAGAWARLEGITVLGEDVKVGDELYLKWVDFVCNYVGDGTVLKGTLYHENQHHNVLWTKLISHVQCNGSSTLSVWRASIWSRTTRFLAQWLVSRFQSPTISRHKQFCHPSCPRTTTFTCASSIWVQDLPMPCQQF